MASSERERDIDSADSAKCVDEPIHTILVVGAGWVGRQIVGQFLAHGLEVTWMDRSHEAIRSGLDWLDQHEPEIRSANNLCHPHEPRDSFSSVVQTCVSLDGLLGFDLVLETVTEQISVKRKVLELVSSRYSAPTIIASNSSYFTPSMLSRFVIEDTRFAHFHFHVPVWQTRLADVAASPRTSESTLSRLAELAKRIGQHPLVQRSENPGYVFNWMLRAVLQSALQLKVKEVATPEDIDIAWKKVTGMPIGPFGMMDQIGLDLVYQTMSTARFVDGDSVWQPLLDQLRPMIDAGKLGVKTGGGFYTYDQPNQ